MNWKNTRTNKSLNTDVFPAPLQNTIELKHYVTAAGNRENSRIKLFICIKFENPHQTRHTIELFYMVI